MVYEVRETALGATLHWTYPDGKGGSVSFSTPGAARAYARETEGHTLTWKRSGRPGSRTWRTEA